MTATLISPLDDGGWFKSSFSDDGGGQCVEVRFITGGVELRDDKTADGPVLLFDDSEWEAFLLGAFNGEFNLR
jgi:hypothetical protein